MILNTEQKQFKAEVVDFFTAERMPEWLTLDKDSAEYLAIGRDLDRKLIERGWYTMHWPGQYGGRDDVLSHTILREMEGYYRAPTYGGHGRFIVGPALLQFGTDEQRAKYLPGISRGDMVIAEGLTEADAGSDLGALRTTALPGKDQNTLLVNGTKLYVTFGHYANAMLLAARTDLSAPKHEGVTLFLIDLDLPGIDIRPLICLTGHRVNEVVFRDVEIRRDTMVGAENRGFYHMALALNYERSGVERPARYLAELEDIAEYCKEKGLWGRDGIRSLIGRLAGQIAAWRQTAWRVALLQQKGHVPSWEASVAELYRKWINPQFGRLLMEIIGPEVLLSGAEKDAPLAGQLQWDLLNAFDNHGQGGRLVTMNAIARRGIRLPKD